MGDQVYPGFYLKRVDPTLTEDVILKKLGSMIREANKEDHLANGGLQVEVLKSGSGNDNVVVMGILLPFNEIRAIFKGRMLGRRPLFINDVDFGIQRNRSGTFDSHMDNQFRTHLKEGQGFLQDPIKLFTSHFKEKVLGGADYMGQQLTILEEKQNLNFNLLKDIPGFLQYFTNEKTSGGLRGTIIQFTSSLEAIQCLYYLNGDTNFSVKGVRFQTPHPTTTEPGKGLGLKGKLVNFAECMSNFHYIPFSVLNGRMFDQDKMKETWKSRCVFCSKFYSLIGVNPDLNWMAATCGCIPERTSYSWPGESFHRLTLGFPFERRYETFQRNQSFQQQPLILLVKGCTPLFHSVEEFRHSAYAAEKVEHQGQKRMLAARFQLGTIASTTVTLSEMEEENDGDVKTKMIYINMELKTAVTELWSPEGVYSIRKVTLIPKETVKLSDPTIFDLERQCNNAAKGTLRRIYFDGDAAVVELTLWVKERFPTDVGETFYMIPIPPSSNIGAMNYSIKMWRNFVSDRQKVTPTQAVTVLSVEKFRAIPSIHPRHRACKVQLEMEENFVLKEMLENKVTGIHFGMTLFINGRSFPAVATSAIVKEGYPNRVITVVYSLPGVTSFLSLTSSCNATMWMGYKEDSMYQWTLEPNMFFLEGEEENPSSSRVPDQELCKIFRSIRACPFTPRVDIRDFLLYSSTPGVSHAQPISPLSVPNDANLTFYNFLNQSQSEAVQGMLKDFIHSTEGPPGCGKTYTCCVGVLELHSRNPEGGMILCVAQTNLAAEVLMECLYKVMETTNYRLTVRRLLARSREGEVAPEVTDRYIHSAMMQHDFYLENTTIHKLIAKKEESERALLTAEEDGALSHQLDLARSLVFSTTDVVICTVGAAVDRRLESHFKENRKAKLQAIFMDEGNLVTLGATLALLNFNPPKMWMLGDYCQLSPCFNSRTSMIACADTCWMRMLTATDYMKKDAPMTGLNEEYRFPKGICEVVSEWCYQGRLRCAQTVMARPSEPFHPSFYSEFPELQDTNILRITYDCSRFRDKMIEFSFHNDKECHIIVELVSKLISVQVNETDIAILTMYQGQLKKIKSLIGEKYPDIIMCTTDSFEGKEASVVIVSMVRSNPGNYIGFIRETNRTNVAISRAINYLFLVSSERTFMNCQIPEVKKLYDIMDRQNINVRLM